MSNKQLGPRLNWKFLSIFILLAVVIIIAIIGMQSEAFSRPADQDQSAENTEAESSQNSSELVINNNKLLQPETTPSKFTYDSGIDIPYPEDGVKGIYLTAHGFTSPDIHQNIMNLLNTTDLNSVVLDVKDDFGGITMALPTENPLITEATQASVDTNQAMSIFEENQIYPIARITTFKDRVLAEKRPDLSFKNPDGSLWRSANGDAYLNPYKKENWEYIVEVAKSAAKAGFKDIQFDYVRFPEGFETFGSSLVYDMGDYSEYGKDSYEARQAVIADFLAYAKQELEPYGADVSADIFGYVATVEDGAPGIGQNLMSIAENVDVVSAMIYPSHWSPGDFGFEAPDLEPYGVIDSYMEIEQERLNSLENPPTSRPWIQDFTASYLAEGSYMTYGAAAVQAQIDALANHGVNEYLLWDAENTYTTGVEY